MSTIENGPFGLKFYVGNDLGMGITIMYLINYNDASFRNN